MPEAVANPLTLVMPIKSPADYEELKQLITKLQSLPPHLNPISVALTKISTVHFARFVFLSKKKLAVITSYDGDFKDYVEAFVREIGPVFDQLLVHMQDPPPIPVADHPEEFFAYVQRHDLKCIPPFYCAYPSLKVLDILTMEKEKKGN